MFKVIVDKRVDKQLEKLPVVVNKLFQMLIRDLTQMGLKLDAWDLKKLSGIDKTYRVRLNYRYRVIIEWREPDLIIVKVSTREGAYK